LLVHGLCWRTAIKPGVASDAPTKEWFSLEIDIKRKRTIKIKIKIKNNENENENEEKAQTLNKTKQYTK
jgi:hypothetical protein